MFFLFQSTSPELFAFPVFIAVCSGRGSDKALFSAVRANAGPPVTLTDRPEVKTKKIMLLQMGQGISEKLTL